MLEKMSTFGPPATSVDARDTHPPKPANFWGELSPSDHMVQIYKDDTVFLDSLEGFVAGGIKAGDGVIIIATPAHLAVLEHRLLTRGIDVGSAAQTDQYIALDARETLAQFMVETPFGHGTVYWPHEERFTSLITDLITRAGRRPDGARRRVRAFGEMVALLWSEKRASATIQLEHLWHRLCQESGLCLFCAYPRAYFTEHPESSIKQICDTHSKVVSG